MGFATTTYQNMSLRPLPISLPPPPFFFHFRFPSVPLLKSSTSSSSFHLHLCLILVFLCFIGISAPAESSSLHEDISTSWRLNVVKNLGAAIYRRRVARSPFMPPTVTSFKPPMRRHKGKKLDPELRVGEPSISIGPPMIRSRSGASRKAKTSNDSRLPSPGNRVPGRSMFPRPPVVVQQSKTSGTRTSEESKEVRSPPSGEPGIPISAIEPRRAPPGGEPGMPQNDQHLTPVTKEDSSDNVEISSDQNTKEQKSKPSKSRESVITLSTNESQHHEIIGFYEVLETIGKTTEELQDILRRENISLDSFLEFIDHGTTRNKVLEFLKLSPSSDKESDSRESKPPSKSNLASKTKYGNESYEADRKKMLIDLPFTEIVHEILIRRAKPLEDSVNISSHVKKSDADVMISEKDFYTNKKNYPKKWNNKIGGSKEKFHKSKRNKKLSKDDNPYLMNSASASVLPAKDSPIVLPFLPPKKKKPDQKGNKQSASIISLTVEKTTKQMVSDSSPQLLLTRSKVFSGKEIKSEILVRGSESSHSAFDSKERHWNVKPTNRHQQLQQSNLRMVFPMQGILMFCGILGTVAAVTILILIVYGAVKCNKKSFVDSYEMSECPNTTVTTS